MENGDDTSGVIGKDTLPSAAETNKKKSSGKTWVLGDPHGAARAITQCFEYSGIDKENDTLICVGDVADGWPEAAEALEELLTVKNLYYCIGNHDWWLMQFLLYGHTPNIWTSQGGYASMESYVNNKHLIEKHRDFYKKQPYYVELDNNLYVHGGINGYQDIKDQDPHDLMWDRDMWYSALAAEKFGGTVFVDERYKEIFIGHTTTSQITTDEPVNALNIWNVDQGGGWEGKLTLMDVDTKEFYQSDTVKDLYPEAKGRG